MNIDSQDKPEGIIFIAAKKLQSNSIVHQLNSANTVNWLQKSSTQKVFLTAYSCSANIQNKLYHIIAEFVPTTFNPNDIHSHTVLETANALDQGSMVWSKYIKLANLCTDKQRVAHAIFGLTVASKTAPMFA